MKICIMCKDSSATAKAALYPVRLICMRDDKEVMSQIGGQPSRFAGRLLLSMHGGDEGLPHLQVFGQEPAFSISSRNPRS
jgi:hypothetical protein